MQWTCRLPGVRGAGALALHLFMIGILVLPHPVIPATITVDDPTGMVMVDGFCSLPEAIDNANDDAATHADCTAGSGTDTIDMTTHVLLTSSNNGSAFGGNGLPIVDSNIAITGNGYSVARDAGASDLFRLFEIASDGELSVDSLTISGGMISDPDTDSLGGGILNNGVLTLENSTVSGNSVLATAYYPYAFGGGILNLGSAYIQYSTVSGNEAMSVDTPGNNLHIASGGGIQNGTFFDAATPLLVIENSTISGNSAESATTYDALAYGGGIYGVAGTMSLVNSTLSSNDLYANGDSYASAAGGGTFITDTSSTFTSATLSSNTVGAESTTSSYEGAGGIEFFPFYPATTVTVEHSVIGNHTGLSNCAGITATEDGGENLADDGTCGSIPSTLTGLSDTLADNMGPTMTHALLDGSTAIDNAPSCVLTVDQRGIARDATCDSGSFEFLPCSAANGEDFVLDGGTTTTEDTYEACNSITVTNHLVMGPSGHLILRTAGSVGFGEGFEIGVDGQLTVELDASIMSPDRQ